MKQVLIKGSQLLLLLNISACVSNNIYEFEGDFKLTPEIISCLHKYDLIAIGELHGTNEAPEIAYNLVKMYHNFGYKVVLALEINYGDEENINSANSKQDSLLKYTNHFLMTSDGRSSQAMKNLICKTNDLSNTHIVCFDQVYWGYSRDSLMGLILKNKLEKFSDYKVVLLAGNVHTQLSYIEFDDKAYSSMLQVFNQVDEGKRKILSLNITYDSGDAWCSTFDGKNGVVKNQKSNYPFVKRTTNFINISDDYLPRYHGEINVNRISVSFPYQK